MGAKLKYEQKSDAIRVSVIIVNWKVRDLLRRCLESLEAQAGPGTEVIVVDNHSQDGSQAMLEDTFPYVNVIANEANLGHGVAMNQGAAIARGSLLIFANPDLLFLPGCLPSLTSFMEERPGVVAATGTDLDLEGRIQIGSRRGRYDLPSLVLDALGIAASRPSLFPSFDHYLVGLPEESACEVEGISGVLLAVRKDAFSGLGGFDARMNHACQDIDLSHRLRATGGRIFYVPEAEVLHFQGRSTRQWRKHKAVQYMEKAVFLTTHYGPHYAILHLIMLPLALLAGRIRPTKEGER